jgi:hypothetical protein
MEVLLDVAQIAAAVMTIAGAVGMFIKWAVVKPIKLYIDQMTYPIQPNANGGRSLPDLINKVDDLKTMLNRHLEDHDTPK